MVLNKTKKSNRSCKLFEVVTILDYLIAEKKKKNEETFISNEFIRLSMLII